MRIVEPGYEILFMMPGEQALALIERVGRIAYKSEDKIDPGTPCQCGGHDKECLYCGGTSWKILPSSHKFVSMILKAERKAKIIKLTREALEGVTVNVEEMAEPIVEEIIHYMEENPAHESVIEHSSATVMFTSNRGFTHELVRHRLAAFTQESTRYCDYDKGKFGKELTVLQPPAYTAEGAHVQGLAEWQEAVNDAQRHYQQLRKYGFAPQIARGVVPHDLKADIAITANFREWRHVFKMRDSKNAHPDMRQLMAPLHEEFRQRVPIIFD